MEQLVSLGKEMLQNLAEHVASYRLGQTVLSKLDRGLGVVEKCARWAVPPPLDQDERPQPELVRPLPWVFFIMMLITLRITRESISLVNLVMGKPPLRSADVVMFIQSKRRYLRTLKYQGNRMMRARTSTQPQQPWYSGLNSLFELTMCFRRQSQNYGNNNTAQVTNNDEVVVIQCNKNQDQEESTIAASLRETESTMERLIEKMMVDLDTESDEDSAFTATNTASPKSDISHHTEADQDTISKTSSPSQPLETDISQTNGDDIHFSPNKNKNSSSTPEKTDIKDNHAKKNDTENQTFKVSDNTENDKTITENSLSKNADEKRKMEENITESAYTGDSVTENTVSTNENSKDMKTCEELALPPPKAEPKLTPKQDSEHFLKNEHAANAQRTPKKEHKMGTKYKTWSNTMKHLFRPKSNGKPSSREAELKRSSSTKSVSLAKHVLNGQRGPIEREVMSE